MLKEKPEKTNRLLIALSLTTTVMVAACAGMIGYWVIASPGGGKKSGPPIHVPVADTPVPYIPPKSSPSIPPVRETSIHLLYFGAEWCGPCHVQGPVVDMVAKQFGDKVSVMKIDYDQHRTIAQQYGVNSLPCIVLLRDGREVERLHGLTGDGKLRNALNNALRMDGRG